MSIVFEKMDMILKMFKGTSNPAIIGEFIRLVNIFLTTEGMNHKQTNYPNQSPNFFEQD